MDKSSKIALVMWTLIPVILIASIWYLMTDGSELKPAPESKIEFPQPVYTPPAFNGSGDKG